MAFFLSIHHTAPAESQASLSTLCTICAVSNPSAARTFNSSRSIGVAKTTSALLAFCMALKKSGTGVEGSAAEDEGRCLGVPGGEMVEATERRLVRAGVRVGSGGTIDPEGTRFDWYDSRRSVSRLGERSVSMFVLPSDENRLAFGFGGGVEGSRAGRGVSFSCEGCPFLLSGVGVPFRAGWSGDGGRVFCVDGGQDSDSSSASTSVNGATSGGSVGGRSGTVNHE